MEEEKKSLIKLLLMEGMITIAVLAGMVVSGGGVSLKVFVPLLVFGPFFGFAPWGIMIYISYVLYLGLFIGIMRARSLIGSAMMLILLGILLSINVYGCSLYKANGPIFNGM